MSWSREGDTVRIEISLDQFEMLLLTLGLATGAAYRNGYRNQAHDVMRLANAINEGNSNWTPYEVKPK